MIGSLEGRRSYCVRESCLGSQCAVDPCVPEADSIAFLKALDHGSSLREWFIERSRWKLMKNFQKF